MFEDIFNQFFGKREKGQQEKTLAWQTGIGLQDVDKLKVSSYLANLSYQHIKGEISFDKVESLLDSYYRENPACKENKRSKEADFVASRIAYLLLDDEFDFTSNQLLKIHKTLFKGIYDFAGKYRDYDIRKGEDILEGESVAYCSSSQIEACLAYDLKQEEDFLYFSFLKKKSFTI